jgi:Derlin-2/3
MAVSPYASRAPFLPWVLLGLGILLNHDPSADLLGTPALVTACHRLSCHVPNIAHLPLSLPVMACHIGIAAGHLYYFLEDVYAQPRAVGGLGGPQILATPRWL